jgi:hypothetical protein
MKNSFYFPICDILGCKNESSSGGIAWCDTGYWNVCSKHLKLYNEGNKQPKMKPLAIKREKSRNKKTGFIGFCCCSKRK